MAKKSRRVRKKGRQTRLSPAQMVQPGASADVARSADATTRMAVVRARPASKAPDLPEEYRYVIADLKRIAVIAGVMLAVLVALAFLLP